MNCNKCNREMRVKRTGGRDAEGVVHRKEIHVCDCGNEVVARGKEQSKEAVAQFVEKIGRVLDSWKNM